MYLLDELLSCQGQALSSGQLFHHSFGVFDCFARKVNSETDGTSDEALTTKYYKMEK